MNTKQKGELSEAKLIVALLTQGKSVSKPFGDNQKYDLIIDDGEVLLKMQVKTGRLRNGVIKANATRSVGIWKKGKEHTRERYNSVDVDLFGIYCPDTDKCYIIPACELDTLEIYLRINPSKNNQTTGIRLAKDYEVL